MNKIGGFLRLLRPVNCLMMGSTVIIGVLIAYGRIIVSFPSLLGFITSFFLTGASMVANDYWDRFVDKVNAPNRPIPSGVISGKTAIVYATILSFIGLVSAFLANLSCLAIATISLLISLAYSFKGKETGLIGNFMVSACVSVPLFYGGFLYVDLSPSFGGLWSLLIFIGMAFLANTGREITKGIVDMEGDRLRRVKSVALRFGARTAAVVAVSSFIVAVSLSVFPWLYGLVSWLYLPFVAIADIGFFSSSFILLRNYSRGNAKKVKNMVLLWMAIGLLAFIAGGIHVSLV